jgi:hypothetical protein
LGVATIYAHMKDIKTHQQFQDSMRTWCASMRDSAQSNFKLGYILSPHADQTFNAFINFLPSIDSMKTWSVSMSDSAQSTFKLIEQSFKSILSQAADQTFNDFINSLASIEYCRYLPQQIYPFLSTSGSKPKIIN